MIYRARIPSAVSNLVRANLHRSLPYHRSSCSLRGTTGNAQVIFSRADVREGATKGSDKATPQGRVRPDAQAPGPGIGETPARASGYPKGYPDALLACVTEALPNHGTESFSRRSPSSLVITIHSILCFFHRGSIFAIYKRHGPFGQRQCSNIQFFCFLLPRRLCTLQNHRAGRRNGLLSFQSRGVLRKRYSPLHIPLLRFSADRKAVCRITTAKLPCTLV